MIEKETELKTAIQREEPKVDPARAKLVGEWESKILEAKEFWADDFKRMREDMQLAYAGATKDWADSDQYVVPIVSRHINQAVAGLYAKHPTVLVERKKRMDYVIWDGRSDTLQAALQSMAAALQPQADPMTGMVMPPMPVDPNAAALVDEVTQVQQKNLMMKRVCQTLKIVLDHYINEQSQNFKKQLKQLVRRTKTCGVGYGFLGYQRKLEKRPEVMSRIADVSAQLARVESLAADLQDGLLPEDSARRDELRSMLADLTNQVEVIVREGPVIDFPRSTEIIVDPKVKQLNGLVGAGWIVREFYLDPDDVKDIYKIDLKGGYAKYRKEGKGDNQKYVKMSAKDKSDGSGDACVWEVWNKTLGQTFTMIEGYCDFVKEPAAPDLPLERFWPLFILTFNDVEHETQRFPLSDVRMLKHPQMEYNRSRELRRLHRRSNTPRYTTVKGRLSEEDKAKLANPNPFDIVELNALTQGEDAKSLLQPFQGVPFDPAMYETNSEMEDVLRTVGAQEANLGGTSGATATEASIGESSRIASVESNVDDLDEFLGELFSSMGEICLLGMDIETVKRIAGPGAQWPQLSRAEMVEETMVSIKGGSSGRPNKAAELANLERGMPFLQQMSGVSMTPIAEKYSGLLDIDTEELIIEGLPSQVALNAMAAKMATAPAMGTDPMNSPNQQGAKGASNSATTPDKVEGGPQPAYPTPMTGI